MEQDNFVYIRRKEVLSPLGDDSSDHLWKIGSALKGTMHLSGLTREEEARWLPDIIGVTPTNSEWGKKLAQYWNNISALVPDGEGRKLNVTLGENKEPVNVNDYILYRYCLVYGRVANKKEEIRKSPKIRFYLFNEKEEKQDKVSLMKTRLNARKIIFALLEDSTRFNAVLKIFSNETTLLTKIGLPIINIDKASDDDKQLMLDSIATNPITINRFIEVANDKNLITQSFIEDCIFYKKLQRVPNTSTILRGSLTIGNTVTEAIAFLGNPINSKVVLELKAEIKLLTNVDYDSIKVKETKKVTKVTPPNTDK